LRCQQDAGFERIRDLYPKPPGNVARYFLLLNDPRYAEGQEATLLQNVDRWERCAPHSPACQHAMKLLTDWRLRRIAANGRRPSIIAPALS